MHIAIWSDLVCPWCGLGQHRLDQAIASFEHRDAVEVSHRSFQLDPNISATPRPVRAFLAEKRGMSDAQMSAAFSRIEALAAADGLSPYHGSGCERNKDALGKNGYWAWNLVSGQDGKRKQANIRTHV